jgi:hypothetical protein
MKKLAVLVLLSFASPSPAAEAPACHGTAVNFLSSSREAATVAAKEHKLVCVLHVSGHFEDPGFT